MASLFNIDAKGLGDELYDVGWPHPGTGLQPHGLQLFLQWLAPFVKGVQTHPGLIGQFLFTQCLHIL